MDEVKPKRIVMLNGDHIRELEYENHTFLVNLPEGVAISDLTSEACWAVLAGKFKEGDFIRARAYDHTWLADLYVKECSGTYAKVILLQRFNLEPETDPTKDVDKYLLKFRGPVLKWCVIRMADKEVIKDKLLSQEEASRWLIEFEKTVG